MAPSPRAVPRLPHLITVVQLAPSTVCSRPGHTYRGYWASSWMVLLHVRKQPVSPGCRLASSVSHSLHFNAAGFPYNRVRFIFCQNIPEHWGAPLMTSPFGRQPGDNPFCSKCVSHLGLYSLPVTSSWECIAPLSELGKMKSRASVWNY